MRSILLTILLFLSVSCSKPPLKKETYERPVFSTEIDHPELKVISDEFFKLSHRNNITFSNKVSIGFANITDENVIGLCYYKDTFREIFIDYKFWKKASWSPKTALIYHELAHCYCQRDHDFDEGTMYPDGSLKAIIQSFMAKQPIDYLKPDGYMSDSCPKSIMYPIIISDYCFKKHYPHYVKEMFNRCKAY